MSDRNNLFPIFLKLETLQTLIVGGGHVGLEKLNALLKNSPSANITLIAYNIQEAIHKLAEHHPTVKLVERAFEVSDLSGKDMVILATNDRKLHEGVRAFSRSRNLLINVADTPDLCDFYLGAVVTKGNLKIGISTNGKSPTIAKRLREYLEEALPDNMNDLLDQMRQIRDQLKGDFNHKLKILNEVTASWLSGKNKKV